MRLATTSWFSGMPLKAGGRPVGYLQAQSRCSTRVYPTTPAQLSEQDLNPRSPDLNSGTSETKRPCFLPAFEILL